MDNQPSFTAEEMRKVFIANCCICTLGKAMRNCSTCEFRVGLKFRPERQNISSVTGLPLTESPIVVESVQVSTF